MLQIGFRLPSFICCGFRFKSELQQFGRSAGVERLTRLCLSSADFHVLHWFPRVASVRTRGRRKTCAFSCWHRRRRQRRWVHEMLSSVWESHTQTHTLARPTASDRSPHTYTHALTQYRSELRTEHMLAHSDTHARTRHVCVFLANRDCNTSGFVNIGIAGFGIVLATRAMLRFVKKKLFDKFCKQFKFQSKISLCRSK